MKEIVIVAEKELMTANWTHPLHIVTLATHCHSTYIVNYWIEYFGNYILDLRFICLHFLYLNEQNTNCSFN